MKPKVWWITGEGEKVGNALGYGTHNNAMRKHTAPYIEFDQNSNIAFQIVSADHFVPVPNKVNVLFTMWEFLDVPESYQKALAEADYVIVPSAFCRDIFAQYTKKRPIICWEGVDPSVYTFKQRSLESKFRFLWVGASNPRKGYGTILEVVRLADEFPHIEFYLKTTAKANTLIDTIKAVKKNWKDIICKDAQNKVQAIIRTIRRIPSPFNAEKVFCYGKNKNVFVDTRKLPVEELVGLYHSSHCFLFPTLGEGWGLTLCEAMATGLPCIAVSETGCKDFFDGDVGFTVKNDIKDLGELPNYKLDKCRAYVPDTQDFLDTMVNVVRDYDRALRKGKRASDRIRTQFTWERSGKRLGDILFDITKKEELKCVMQESSPSLA
jgi:glycosyltransferase involved in cell wall biosynthesis